MEHTFKKGDLLRNKVTGDIAILRANPYTRFYPDAHHFSDGIESGTAETCFPITFTVIQDYGVNRSVGVGVQVNVRQQRFHANWERLGDTPTVATWKR